MLPLVTVNVVMTAMIIDQRIEEKNVPKDGLSSFQEFVTTKKIIPDTVNIEEGRSVAYLKN